MAHEQGLEMSRRHHTETRGPLAKAGPLLGGEPARRSRAAARDEQTSIGQAIETYFEDQARLPPAGMTGFDPRLSPAWAGLQIPG
jgi:hypothetical protein